MGAHESTGRKSQNAEESSVVDYYSILKVSEDATPEEIKRSFRRLALIHHPDKNFTDVEEATQRFSAIQQAYDVLSDDQERAWYDSHRASLVPEPDAQSVFEEISKGSNLAPRTRDRGLTVKHLSPFFDVTIWKTYEDDGEKSFFMIYRNLFSRLAAEESLHASDVDYPSFGSSTWLWSAPSNENISEAVRNFYNVWIKFSTEKDFSWMDQWNLFDAPERRVRRLMERDNKKARDDARREYNETVRSLVKFIRKRDPRYKVHLESQAKNTSVSKIPSSAQQIHQKVVKPYVEQEWQKVDTARLHADVDWAIAEGGDLEEWECVACRKTFRSEAAWNSHERSKKHIKELENLKQEMEEEDDELGLELEHPSSDGEKELFDAQGEPILDPSNSSPPPETPQSESHKSELALDGDTTAGDNHGNCHTDTISVNELSKREKRRVRQAKKAESDNSGPTHHCNVCSEVFPSRTKLFNHITEEGHALALLDQDTKPQRSKKKRK